VDERLVLEAVLSLGGRRRNSVVETKILCIDTTLARPLRDIGGHFIVHSVSPILQFVTWHDLSPS